MKTNTPTNQGADDLDYLADLGYAAVPVSQTDVEQLKKKVRRLTFGNSWNWSLFYFALGLLAGGFVLYFLLPARESNAAKLVEEYSEKPSVQSETTPTLILDTIEHLAENFVKPERTLKQTEEKKVDRESGIEESADPVALEPLELKTVPEAVLERNLKFIANSQVFYLHDLKITNYTSLYFKKNEFMGLRGTPADQLSPDKVPGSSLKQQARTYLHEEIASAMLLYKQGKYDQVLHSLILIRTYTKNDLNCDFYAGMCWFQKKYFANAIPFFDVCIEADNNTFYQEALYYKALALKETGKREQALLLLQRVVNEQGFYAKKASELLQTL